VAGERTMSELALETLLRRDRFIVGAALAVLALAAWLYLFHLAAAMSDMGMSDMPGMPGMPMAMPDMHPWSWVEAGSLAVMWAVMMVAMMTPSAAPMILMFASVHRRRATEGRPAVPTAVFVLGYLVVWTIFSVAAAVTQTGLHTAALLSPAMATTSPLLAGGLLIVAGVFQWTPLKRACLATCRSPLSFLMSRWREGRGGAFMMGLRHGLYCLGCCWALMALLFVAGVMNLLWVAAIAAAVLVEKVVPRGDLLSRLAGVALVAAGLLVVARAFGG
jgi:predicted metal-binding membrane protein